MATAIDPICQMDVDTENPHGGQSEHEGTTYYFCAPGCKVDFDKEPDKYLAEEGAEHEDHGHDEHGHDEHGHDDHGHDEHGHGGPGHSLGGHHMPESATETQPASQPVNRPGFLARLFGKK